MINFPNSPTTGQIFIDPGGAGSWRWDGTKWVTYSTTSGSTVTVADTPPSSPLPGNLWWNSSAGDGQLYVYYADPNTSQWVITCNLGGGQYLPLSGGTMTGPIALAADPASALQPATKQYADAATGVPNKLINPFMEIDQANEGAAVAIAAGSGGNTVDGWRLGSSGTTSPALSAQRVADAPPGYTYSVRVTNTGTAAVAANSQANFQYIVEADDLYDTQLGTSSAQTLSLAFWFKASVTGTYCFWLTKPDNSRTYIFDIVVGTANTWTLYTKTLPGDTTGGWATSGNAGGMKLGIQVVCGTTYQTASTNAWIATVSVASTAISNTFATTASATCNLGPVGLWVAPAPQPLLRTSFQTELSRCQRYYEKSYDLGSAPGSSVGPSATVVFYSMATALAATSGTTVGFKVTKRASPTITMYSTVGPAGKVRDATNNADINANVAAFGINSFNWSATMSAANTTVNMQGHWTADARL